MLRVHDGDVVTAADGHGRWRAYAVTACDAPSVSMRASGELVHEPRLVPGLAVACALTKGEKPELVVQKLTELGVDAIVLVRATRSVVRWDDERAASAMTRLRRVAREAGSQCRRARLPLLDGPLAVWELARTPDLVVADPGGGAARGVPLPPAGAGWTVAVGPEGGFDDDELELLAGAPRLRLSPHVLRAETAAIAAAAALTQHRVADPPVGEREE